MRGTQGQIGAHLCGVGIIPAHAGNTLVSFMTIRVKRDHPRACGEHAHCGSRKIRFPGSSPRMRGTLSNSIGWLRDKGIIPAHAGNTVGVEG